MAKEKTYSSKDISTFAYPDNVRKFSSMYIGSTDEHGLFLILRELLDNVVDEYMAGRAKTCRVNIDFKNNLYHVYDDGTGIPQGVKSQIVQVNGKDVKSKMPTMQAIFGALHTSGKHSDAYKTSRGVHGIGVKATNAMSASFKVWTYFEGEWHFIEFSQGKIKSKGVVNSKPPTKPFGKLKKGTLIEYSPDLPLFSAKKFAPEMMQEWSYITAFLHPKFTIEVTGVAKDTQTYFSERGPLDYLEQRIESLNSTILIPGVSADGESDKKEKPKAVNTSKLMFEFTTELADVVVAFTDYDGQDLRGFTNGLENIEGGTHVNSVQSALFRACKAYSKKKHTFNAHDFREGLVGLVNAKLSGAKFSSQAKVKLTDERMDKDFEESVFQAAEKFFKSNKKLALMLLERATTLSGLKSQFKASKKALKALKTIKKVGMPAKYAGAHPSSKVDDRELFIVEGDSAGGGLKNARGQHQAILPLRGKILNALKAKQSKLMASQEVINILGAIGFNPDADDPFGKLQVGKIIFLADPDPDGPFVGDTLIDVMVTTAEGWEERQLPICGLVHSYEFQVPVWIDGRQQWRKATAHHVADVDTLVSMEIGNHKYKVSESHKFVVVRTKATRDRECTTDQLAAKGYPNLGDTLAFIEARNMRIGDRVWCPSNEGGRKDFNKQDKFTGRGFVSVNKLRVQKLSESVPVYCLDVPKHHHFILPSGAVSGNCHINVLLATLFYKYMGTLFDRGMVYVANTPEFYAYHKDTLVSGDKMSVVRAKLDKLGAKASTPIQHIKGWGEVDEEELKHFALNENTRKLIRLSNPKPDRKEFEMLMNENVQYRKKLVGV